jgi:hypothetical protein
MVKVPDPIHQEMKQHRQMTHSHIILFISSYPSDTFLKGTVRECWIRLKLSSFDMYLLKRLAQRFLENLPVPHPLRAL